MGHRLAIVGWATDSGVGREFTDAIRHLPVTSAFVLKNSVKATRHDLLKAVPHYLSTGEDLPGEMEDFLEEHRPTTILTWEVPGDWTFPAMWNRRGIRWVHTVHWDWFAPSHMSLWKMADLVAPNVLCKSGLRDLGMRSTLLPVPVDTDRFPFELRREAIHFATIYGYGGMGNRRGLPEILAAWGEINRDLSKESPLLIRAQQQPAEITPEISKAICLRLGNPSDPNLLFRNIDIAIQISRFEGVGLSLLEAQSCGVPVITVDGDPMRELAPDLLVPVDRTENVSIMGKPVAAHIAAVPLLARRIQELDRRDIRDLSMAARARVQDNYSWRRWKDPWIELLLN